MASSRFSAVKSRPPAVRLGSETPRIFTPPLRELTPATSRGFSVIEFASDVLQVTLLPWQRWLLTHALELREDGSFRFRNVVVLVARQNGKSTLSQVLALWFMYVYGFQLVLGTAQDLDTAEEVWQGAVDLVTETDDDDVPVRPDLFELYDRTSMVNGKKFLALTTGARYKVKAASRRAGRGLSGDLVLMDELREHQSWAAWGAITKTTMARDEAQVWCLSNAGDALSVVLGYLRLMAHAAIGDPDGINRQTDLASLLVEGESDDFELDDDDTLGIFEWSAPPGIATSDRDGWAQANPSMGHLISERTIASAQRTDPEAIFRTEVLCQWVEALSPTAIDYGAWMLLADPGAERGQPTFGVVTAPDRSWSAIAAAWKRPDGLSHVELAAYKEGSAWVPEKVAQLQHEWRAGVVVDTAWRGQFEGAIEPSSGVQVQAHNALADAVESKQIRHLNHEALNVSVKASVWKLAGDSRALDRKGTADISPLVAVALALHGVGQSGPSVYEERGLVTL